MDERTFDVYVIGALSRQDEMQKAALYYLSHDYSVKMLTVDTSIGECFNNIDRCRQGIVVVTYLSGINQADMALYLAIHVKLECQILFLLLISLNPSQSEIFIILNHQNIPNQLVW